jgi:hypothetical protein
MTEIAFTSRTSPVRRIVLQASAATALLCLLLSGCAATRKRPAFPWATASIVRPMIPAPEMTGPGDAPPPRLESENADAPPMPSALAPARLSPARPRALPAPAPEPERTLAAPPVIAAQMTAEEAAAAQLETNAGLGEAEKNLASMNGSKLNSVQADMASKIRGFIEDARQAAKGGDWSRARSLAKKAQVLSEELVKTR